jgi:hypothetical protein
MERVHTQLRYRYRRDIEPGDDHVTGTATLPEWHPAPAAGSSPASPPVPGSLQAAREAGAKVGKVHGEFRAWAESFLDLFTSTRATGGMALWDRLPPEERLRVIAKVQWTYDNLPALPPAGTVEQAAAMRAGFADAAKTSYEAERLMNQAVWAACELAKAAALARAAAPTPTTIAGFSDKFSDCAAQTASRAIQEMTGVEVPAGYLVRTFGLPRTTLSGFNDAMAYAKNWFVAAGIRLANRAGGLAPVAQGGTAGRYVLFLRGGSSGGHVVFAEVTATSMRVIDNQLGTVWGSVEEASRALGMAPASAWRIESITLPQ